ncbi:MAG: hypothetical protein LC751_12935 [Actinobacteria bacterium]|nr:hypothetical protein [Actinomycetota bacterium]MCA1739323.1 hypothetical protein [Actinomycetota bacterium]
MFGYEIMGSLSNLFFYALYLVLVLVGGVWGAFLFYSRPTERWNFTASEIIIYVFALLAAMALILLRHPSLPIATFSDGTAEEAILISHQAGYWYVLQEDERSLTAIPDDEAGKVSISKASP